MGVRARLRLLRFAAVHRSVEPCGLHAVSASCSSLQRARSRLLSQGVRVQHGPHEVPANHRSIPCTLEGSHGPRRGACSRQRRLRPSCGCVQLRSSAFGDAIAQRRFVCSSLGIRPGRWDLLLRRELDALSRDTCGVRQSASDADPRRLAIPRSLQAARLLSR